MLPSAVATSTWFGEAALRSPVAASSSSRAARTNACARSSSAKVEAPTSPSSPKSAADSICDEISVRSASAWAASMARLTLTQAILRAVARPKAHSRAEVLRRSGHAPRRDGGLLRAALLRPADLPRPLAPRVDRTGRRVDVPRAADYARPARRPDRAHRRPRQLGAPERDDARDHRRRGAPLDVALLLQRPRVGLQHRLRTAEPLVPAREGDRAPPDGRLARDALRRAARRLDRRELPPRPRTRRGREQHHRLRALDRDLDPRRLRLPRLRLLLPDQRGRVRSRRAARRRVRGDRAGGDFPGAADLRPLHEAEPDAAHLRRHRDPARLALRDGERDRLRRRGELVVRAAESDGRRADGGRPRSGLARGGQSCGQGARRAGAVRVLRLPGVPELGHRLRLALGDEDRVVAESLAASGLLGDPALQRPLPAELRPLRRDAHELADVARASPVAVHALELGEERLDRLRGPAGGADARPPAEPGHLDPRVLAEDPLVAPQCVTELRLRACVLVVGRARLGRQLRVEQADLPPRERAHELLRLVRVRRREEGPHWPQRIPRTPSSSETALVVASRASSGRSTSSAMLRRSSSLVTVSDSIRPPPSSTAARTGAAERVAHNHEDR